MKNITRPSIVLLGGSSCVGKTTAAAALCATLELEHLQLNALPYASSDPELRLLTGEPGQWDLPVEELVHRLWRRGKALARHLRPCIEAWRQSRSRVLFEWEGVSPEFSSDMRSRFAVAAVFIIETNRTRLHQTLSERSESFRALSEPRKKKVVEMNCSYGEWLRDEAVCHNEPWVASQPWESLQDRIGEALSMARQPDPADSASPHG